jgi:hypothetical protein
MQVHSGDWFCRWVSILFIVLLVSNVWAQAPSGGALDLGKFPIIKNLPDPFLLNGGTRVATRADWMKRREEIKELLFQYQYGHMAPPPGNVKGSEISAQQVEGLGASERQILLSMGPAQKLTFRLILTVPSGDGPFPVIVKGDLCWGRVPSAILAAAIKRDYMVAEFDRTEVALDSADRAKGVYPLYPDQDWAALAAWAWGYQRVVDYLVAQKFVDGKRVIVTGHSRGGKAVLLAGALDERIALTAPNGSGCGGGGCYRIQGEKSEDIGAITARFPYWFHPRLASFVGHVDQLPFDQHYLKALVAPRSLFSTEALGDLWANPLGSGVSYLAAKEVFKFLGASSKVGIHYREGKHEQNAEDWNALLDFADCQLQGKPSGAAFDKLPFSNVPEAYSWKSPAP